MRLLKNRYIKFFPIAYLVYFVNSLLWKMWRGEPLNIQGTLSETFFYSLFFIGFMWFFEWAKPPPRKEDP